MERQSFGPCGVVLPPVMLLYCGNALGGVVGFLIVAGREHIVLSSIKTKNVPWVPVCRKNVSLDSVRFQTFFTSRFKNIIFFAMVGTTQKHPTEHTLSQSYRTCLLTFLIHSSLRTPSTAKKCVDLMTISRTKSPAQQQVIAMRTLLLARRQMFLGNGQRIRISRRPSFPDYAFCGRTLFSSWEWFVH